MRLYARSPYCRLGWLLFLPCLAQCAQDYVGRFDVYNGFTYFRSPDIHLNQRGYHLQAGYNARTWLALGFDYSVAVGTLPLTADLLRTDLQTSIAGSVPRGYQLSVPTDTSTQTFAAGPQLEYRRFSSLTFFIRPSIGAIHEVATPHAGDPVATAIVRGLAPEGQKTEWAGFYGVGGGFEVNPSRHFSLRVQADFVHNDLFTDILSKARNTTRLSIGPAVHFGKNIAH